MNIRAEDPTAQIVAGNIVLQGEVPGDLSDAYWDQVRNAPAVQWHVQNKKRLPWDVVGIHPYNYVPVEGASASLSAELEHWNLRVDSPVAITEYGWSGTRYGAIDPATSQPRACPFWASEATTANYVSQTFQIARSKGLPFVVWFNYLSAPGDGDCGVDFGLRDGSTGHAWRPSAKAFCDAAGASSCPVAAGARFCPKDAVPRRKMAVFLERLMHVGAPGWMPTPAKSTFNDVPATDPDASWIEQLRQDRVTTGCDPQGGLFCPDAAVPREQMAAFLIRAKYGHDYPNPGNDPFTDVPRENQFAGDIAQLASEGITTGCGGGAFCPQDLVPREQMAAFLMRWLRGPGGKAPPAPNRFVDVGSDNPFQDDIAQAVDKGIMDPCL